MPKLPTVLLAALLAAAPLAVFAADANVTVANAWARPSAGAAYVTLTNGGAEADRLVGAASAVAGKVEIHNHLMEDGVMKMRPVAGVDVEPGAPVKMEPGGLHIMLIGLKAPLKEGESFQLELKFQKGGSVTTTVPVGGHMPGHMPGHMQHGQHH
jgi:copper(I)-binding protein